MGSIKVGDMVIGSKGLPIKVLEVHPQGMDDVYEVQLSDGRTIRCGLEHLWNVTTPEGKELTLEVKYILQDYCSRGLWGDVKYKYYIKTGSGAEYSEKKYPLGAYTKGFLIGRGLSSSLSDIYKLGSRCQRMNILHGIMDIRGNCSSTGVLTTYFKNEFIANDVADLSRSLGIKTRIVKTSGKYYLYMSTKNILFKRNKEQMQIQTSVTDFYKHDGDFTAITNITKLDYKEHSTCLTVDAEDCLYLTTDYTVTHNTYIVLSIAHKTYHIKPNSHCIISASKPTHASEAFSKLGDSIDLMPNIHPTLALNKIIDSKTMIKSGQEVVRDGIKFIEGPGSKIQKVVYGDNPGITKGTRPDIQLTVNQLN